MGVPAILSAMGPLRVEMKASNDEVSSPAQVVTSIRSRPLFFPA